MDELFHTLPKLLRAAGDSEEVAEAAAFVAWRRVAGEGLRGCAVPFRLYNKTLVVSVPDATWRKQLEGVCGHMLFRINSLLGQAVVTYVEFRVDPKTVREERARMSASQHAPPVEDEESALRNSGELGDAANAIHDEDLRRRFLLAAGSCMNRRSRQ